LPSGLWTFWDFSFIGGPNLIGRWYDNDLSDEARFMFDDLLKVMQKTSNHKEWTAFRHFMKGQLKNEKVWELGFYCDGRQYRVLSKFGQARKQVVFLVGCYHKNRVYTPTDALELAYKRSRAISAGKVKLYERKIRTDK
jgi:hypothetical protein